MKKMICGLALVFLAGAICRAETVRAVSEVDWEVQDGRLITPHLRQVDGISRLKMEEYISTGRFEARSRIDERGDSILEVSSPVFPTAAFELWHAQTDQPDGVARYKISGEIKYIGQKGFAYLQLQSTFGNGGGDWAQNTAPGQRIESADWMPFEITCSGDPKASLPSMVFSIGWQVEGISIVSLRRVRITEYAPLLPLTPLEQKQATKWSWIGGVSGGIIGLLAGWFVVRAAVAQAKRRRQTEELRRMASLDSVEK